MHQPVNRVDSIVMPEDSMVDSPAVETSPGAIPASTVHRHVFWSVHLEQGVEKFPDFDILSDIGGAVVELVLDIRIAAGFLDKENDAFEMTKF